MRSLPGGRKLQEAGGQVASNLCMQVLVRRRQVGRGNAGRWVGSDDAGRLVEVTPAGGAEEAEM